MRGFRLRALDVGVEARREVMHERGGALRMADEGLRECAAARRDADLEARVAVRPQEIDLVPPERGGEHELVQGIALDGAGADRRQRREEAVAVAADVDARPRG